MENQDGPRAGIRIRSTMCSVSTSLFPAVATTELVFLRLSFSATNVVPFKSIAIIFLKILLINLKERECMPISQGQGGKREKGKQTPR